MLLREKPKKEKLKKKIGDFKGEKIYVGLSWNDVRMWVCPSCDKILGFSESAYSS